MLADDYHGGMGHTQKLASRLHTIVIPERPALEHNFIAAMIAGMIEVHT